MSTTTIKVGDNRNLVDPQSFLDAQASAILTAQGLEGIAGWVFDIPTGESVDMTSDLTEHYVESGSFVEDHVVRKPITITLTGLKGEVVYTPPKNNTLTGGLNQVTTLLTPVTAYMQNLTPQAAQKMTSLTNNASYAAKQYSDIQQRGSNLISYFSGSDNSKNLQQKAFAQLSALWNSLQIMTVQTPWTFFQNMMISSLGFRQNDTQNDYTEISVTLKEMRFVSVQTTTFNSGAYKSAIDAQAVTQQQNGKVQAQKVNCDDTALQIGHSLGFVPKSYTNCP